MFQRHSFQHLITSLFAAIVLAWLPTILTAATTDAKSGMVLTGQRVLILGDSITQDGRYVTFLEYFLHQLTPGEKSDLISIGLSAETLSGLSEKSHPFPRPCVLERLDRALKTVKPQLVFACYGMNDGIYHPPSAERLAAFNRGLHQLITQVRATGARLVLLTPPVFDTLPIRAKTVPATATEFGYSTPYAGYDEVLGEFSSAELAIHEPCVTTIDLHRALVNALAAQREHDSTFTFAPDGVHPNDAGHLLIALTILQGLGYAQANSNLAAIQADPLFPLIRERRQLRSEAWLPFVGYNRGDPFKSASVTAAEEVVSRLQNEINAAVLK